MEASPFDEEQFFRALEGCGARVLLIGRRALAALGLPVLTADYDLWIHPDDIEKLNGALEPLGLSPTHPAAEARARGRYVLENGDHVDVLVARQQSTKDGEVVRFDDVWTARQSVRFDDRTAIAIPSLADLVLTKKWSMREKDVIDIQQLRALMKESS
ncbi:MAG: hypothetical protein ABI175_02240 [Polyangiales bacterium]